MRRLVNGSLVEWSGKGEEITATVDGRTRAVKLAEVEPGVYSVLCEGESYTVRIARHAGAWIATADHHAFEFEIADPRDARNLAYGAGGAGRKNVTSPMPGKVVRVMVAAGDHVEQGQGLVVVEAMKMQNEMKSPKAGVVIAVNVTAGAGVAAGEVLVTLE